MGPAVIALAAFQAISGMHEAELIRGQSLINQGIADLNAKYTEQDAWEAEKYGYTESTRYQSVIDATISQQRLSYAAQGVDVNAGTAAEVQKESKLTGFLNTLDIQNQARAKALGLKIQASNIRLGSYMSGVESGLKATGVERRGLLDAAATGISGYTKAGGTK